MHVLTNESMTDCISCTSRLGGAQLVSGMALIDMSNTLTCDIAQSHKRSGT